jgi:UDP-galactopyranose mutase
MRIKGKEIPYYPIPKKENVELYSRYKEKTQNWDNIIFVGRLAEYRYYNMSDVIKSALNIFRNDIQ